MKTTITLGSKTNTDIPFDITTSDDLFSEYNLVSNTHKGKLLISANDIICIIENEFEKVDNKIIESIFDIARNCNKREDFNRGFNFIISAKTGEIEIGRYMSEIKDKIVLYEENFRSHKNSNYSKITIEL